VNRREAAVARLTAGAVTRQDEIEQGLRAVLVRAVVEHVGVPLWLDEAILDDVFDEAVLPSVRQAWRREVGALALEVAFDSGFPIVDIGETHADDGEPG
jgi:hypothetical protein